MLTVRIPSIGEIFVDISTLVYSCGKHFIVGKSEDGSRYTLALSKISWQEDYIYEYGWVHIVEYIINGNTVPCNHYTSIG